jgi:hypothetical protein
VDGAAAGSSLLRRPSQTWFRISRNVARVFSFEPGKLMDVLLLLGVIPSPDKDGQGQGESGQEKAERFSCPRNLSSRPGKTPWLEPEIGPLKQEHGNQDGSVDEQGKSPLVVQILPAAIPEENKDGAGEYGRAHDYGTPPALPGE